MAFFTKLAASLSRARRKAKRDALREQLKTLISLPEALAQAGTEIDPKFSAGLDACREAFRKEERFHNVAAWIGAPQARFLLRRPDNVDLLTPLMRQWLDSDLGCYDFDGLKLPLPANEVDAAFWSHLFEDVIIYYLLKNFDPVFIFSFFPDSEGPYEWNEQLRIRENDVVFDCGANAGCFSALAAAKGGRVYAFEPSRHIRETYLEKTAALNGNFEICPYALSDSPGILEFVVCHDNLGASRINQADEKKDALNDIETVEALRLDDFVTERNIERVDFIKADIEGAERKMLTGATQILKTFAPKLSICTYHLPDDPQVLADIIRSAQPQYKIIQGPKKLYAYVE